MSYTATLHAIACVAASPAHQLERRRGEEVAWQTLGLCQTPPPCQCSSDWRRERRHGLVLPLVLDVRRVHFDVVLVDCLLERALEPRHDRCGRARGFLRLSLRVVAKGERTIARREVERVRTKAVNAVSCCRTPGRESASHVLHVEASFHLARILRRLPRTVPIRGDAKHPRPSRSAHERPPARALR